MAAAPGPRLIDNTSSLKRATLSDSHLKSSEVPVFTGGDLRSGVQPGGVGWSGAAEKSPVELLKRRRLLCLCKPPIEQNKHAPAVAVEA